MPLCADASTCTLWDTQGHINHWIQSISQWHHTANELLSQYAAGLPAIYLCFIRNWNKQAHISIPLDLTDFLVAMLYDFILNCGSIDLVTTVQMTCLNIENETILGHICFFCFFSCLDPIFISVTATFAHHTPVTVALMGWGGRNSKYTIYQADFFPLISFPITLQILYSSLNLPFFN